MSDPTWLQLLRVELNRIAEDADRDLREGTLGNADKYAHKYNGILDALRQKGYNLMSNRVTPAFDQIPQHRTFDEAKKAALTDVRHEARTLSEKLRALLTAEQTPVPALARVERICNRFHLVAQCLSRRRVGHAPFAVQDEYDVQDLVRGLLTVDFTDVRPEEWTPSYAGGSSRMDFLVKQHKLVIETKMTRAGLGAKEVGEQLLIDIARYGEHPDCQTLVCFVYDPGALIANPRGVEADLARASQKPFVRVFIRPTGE